MITLIHGSDVYFSYLKLNKLKQEYIDKGYEVKIINVDDEFEVSDPSSLFAILSEQDLFATNKVLILKRIASADYFYKLGKALKESTKLFDALKSSPHEIILWEDKIITTANPLSKLSKHIIPFNAPSKDYEVMGYILKNFPDLSQEIKTIMSKFSKAMFPKDKKLFFNTWELATEIEKLKIMPKQYISNDVMAVQQNQSLWMLGDYITAYLLDSKDDNLKKLFAFIDNLDEEVIFKLNAIQNHISDIIATKRSKNDSSVKDVFFKPNRNFIYSNILRYCDKINMNTLYELYKNSLIVEYYLKNGLISEKVALMSIFLYDSKSMSLELLSE
ncbi:MAG: hypothetical protein WCJ19_00465 [bacterium]